MKILAIILSVILFHPLNAYTDILPVAASYDGVGGVFGAAYSTQTGPHSIIAGGVSGDVNAVGGLYTYSFSKDLQVSAGLLTFTGLNLVTTYKRSLLDDQDDQYILSIEGSAFALGSKLWLLSDYLTLGFSAIQSTIKLNSYKENTALKVDLAEANLFDIETTNLKLSMDFNYYDNPRSPTQGLGLNTSISQISGRTGQSDQLVLDYSIKTMIPIFSHFSLILNAKYSDAIVDVNESYDTDPEVRNALNAQCSTVADANERAKCEKLENSLVAYILENNIKGTATPIGGSSGLRSFRELRFKAAHTAIYTTEFITSLSSLLDILNSEGLNLSFVVFHDIGHVNDDKLRLFNNAKYSNGGSLRFIKNSNAINLQAATGSDNSKSWSLNFGKSF